MPHFFKLNQEQKNFFTVEGASELVTHELLEPMGVVINTRLGLFICVGCSSCYTVDGAISHMQRKHPECHMQQREIQETLYSIAKEADICNDYPDIQGTVVAYEGLTVQTSTGCPHCPYAASDKVVKRHVREKHSGEDHAPLEQTVKVQVLNSGHCPAYFRVVEAMKDTTPITSNIVQELESYDWREGGRTGDIPNARMISPWLMRTGWHVYVNGHNISQLHALVSMPKPEEFVDLQKGILAYFERATDMIDMTDELVLQRLNTSDPDKG